MRTGTAPRSPSTPPGPRPRPPPAPPQPPPPLAPAAAVLRDGEAVVQARLAAGDLQGGGEHERAVEVLARGRLGGVVICRLDDARPRRRVQQAAERARAVEARQAAPVDRAAAGDERGG